MTGFSFTDAHHFRCEDCGCPMTVYTAKGAAPSDRRCFECRAKKAAGAKLAAEIPHRPIHPRKPWV